MPLLREQRELRQATKKAESRGFQLQARKGPQKGPAPRPNLRYRRHPLRRSRAPQKPTSQPMTTLTILIDGGVRSNPATRLVWPTSDAKPTSGPRLAFPPIHHTLHRANSRLGPRWPTETTCQSSPKNRPITWTSPPKPCLPWNHGPCLVTFTTQSCYDGDGRGGDNAEQLQFGCLCETSVAGNRLILVQGPSSPHSACWPA
ncbi:hypothetical protein BC567DRAFT_281405 [Phyllosticta citribraziliensis]